LHALHKAEQVRLLVRLAADSGARRGELVALRFVDLDGRVLTVERAASAEQVGPTKTRQVRRLTLGRTTVELWRASEAAWRQRAVVESEFGEWLFSRDLDHGRRLTTSGLGHWFGELRDEADLPGVSLHRLRHTVATYLEMSNVAVFASLHTVRDEVPPGDMDLSRNVAGRSSRDEDLVGAGIRHA
jgi:integrase